MSQIVVCHAWGGEDVYLHNIEEYQEYAVITNLKKYNQMTRLRLQCEVFTQKKSSRPMLPLAD